MLLPVLLIGALLAGCGGGAQVASSGSPSAVSSAAVPAASSASSASLAAPPSAAASAAPSAGSRSSGPQANTAEPTRSSNPGSRSSPTPTSSASAAPASPAAPAGRPAPAALAPGGLVTQADFDKARTAVAAMSVADRAGTVTMVSSADAVGSDLVAELHLGGVILMGSDGSVDGTQNGTPAEVAAVAAALQKQVLAQQTGAPVLIATDQEYGLVTRLVNGFTDFPGAAELAGIPGTAAAAEATEAVTAAAGDELRAVGINVNFAPDADVVPESGGSGVADRTFGSNPRRSAALVAAAVRGYQSAGVAATVKHFPGIGRVATDTHQSLPTLDVSCDEWNAVDAVPLLAGVDAGAALVMTGHIELPAVGATGKSAALSPEVVTELLKGGGVNGCSGANFKGVTVSDSFEMAPVVDNYGPAEAAWRGVAAGQDLILMPTDPRAAVAGIMGAVRDRSLPADRLQDAATAVYALRLALGRSQRPPLDVVGTDAHQAVAEAARNG